LKRLKENEALEDTEYYKYFINTEFQLLNKHGYKVSGGERSEFNLLQSIQDAQQYDMLLIDEPESSFDNLFLMNEVNSLIKEISKHIPVIIVTHNSTVGASIKPDYILYTKKEVCEKSIEYKLFTGYPSDKELFSLDGESISNYSIMLNCLEAGKEAYKDRRYTYEILNN
jgi:ABC-type phosphate transport system ATPase subunit